VIELVRPLETRDTSPFAAARIARQLTVEEVARRAAIPPDHVRWLEEGRVYRFRSPDAALTAALLYASALGIEHHEARGLAGVPAPPLPLRRGFRRRAAALAAAALAAGGLAAALLLPGNVGSAGEPAAAAAEAEQSLPPAWEISVEVLNGNGDINWTRQVASRIGALAYHIAHVGKADRFDYQQTSVYYEEGGEAVAIRLARQLGVVTKPLPAGNDPARLVVVVGPRKGPGQ
jgi:transcriptional regulator with XRE-family HTH domain